MNLGETIDVTAYEMLQPLVGTIITAYIDGEDIKARIVGATSSNMVQIKRVLESTKE